MKRFLLLIAISFLLSLPSFANHISGGEIYYTYTRQSGNAFLYHITLKLLHTCNSHELNTQAKFTVLNKKTFEVAWDGLAPRTGLIQKFITEPNPCITNPPQICNEVGYYEVDVLLPSSTDGYIIIYE